MDLWFFIQSCVLLQNYDFKDVTRGSQGLPRGSLGDSQACRARIWPLEALKTSLDMSFEGLNFEQKTGFSIWARASMLEFQKNGPLVFQFGPVCACWNFWARANILEITKHVVF